MLNIDVSYKKLFFGVFFVFPFLLQDGGAHLAYSPFIQPFFSSMFFPIATFPFYPFFQFFFSLLMFPFYSYSFLHSSFVCLSLVLLLLLLLLLFLFVVCSLMCCSVVVTYNTSKLFNYRCLFFVFLYTALYVYMCVYIIYNIILCICVYINRDIHYTYYILIYS